MAKNKKCKKETPDLTPIKIVGANLGSIPKSGTVHVLNTGETVSDYDDCVILPTGFYCSIFGKAQKNASRENKLLSVVKIQYKGTSIYRRYIGVNITNTHYNIAMTPKSWLLLSNEYQFPNNNDNIHVKVSKGCKLKYFWYHPFHATRISMRIGTIGALIGVIGCILTICLS